MAMISRCRQPEQMDDPSLAPEAHLKALHGLESLNRWGRGAKILWQAIQPLLKQNSGESLRMLDIATGSGDVPIELWCEARQAGFNIQIDGCDISSRSIDWAREKAQRAGVPASFFELDALHDNIPETYDVILSSLFFHHLDSQEAIGLLRKMSHATRSLILVSDLERGWLNLVLVYVATHMVTTSSVVRHDGPVSVRAAYTIEEMKTIANQAGLSACTIERRFPCRFLLTWRRS